MRAKAYWVHRAEARMDHYLRDSQRTVATVSRAYGKALQDIQGDMERIFGKYARDHGLTSAQARAFLEQAASPAEYERLLAQIASVKDPAAKRLLTARANAPAYRYRMSRAEAVAESIHARMGQVADFEMAADREAFTRTIRDAYGRSMFDIQRGTGYGFSFADISTGQTQAILRNPWSGAQFSQRVWHNSQVLADQLQKTVTAGFLSGRSVHDMADDMMALTDHGRYAAMRVIRTETTYMANAAEMQSYREAGIDKYEFMATLDNRTSPFCQELDGQVFDVADAQPGKNMPPMHPHCRSTTVARFDDDTLEGLQRRAKDPVTGETILVPRDMTYRQWQEKFASTESRNRGIIDIMMDEWTPCLIDRKTGHILDTEIKPVGTKKLNLKGWSFDWDAPARKGYETYALRIKGNPEIQGMLALKDDSTNQAIHVDIVEAAPHNIGKKGKYKGVGPHLFAYAGKLSIDHGYDYVYFDAKTALIEHYTKSLGAQQLGGSQRMILEGGALHELVSYYYGKT